MSTVVAIYLAEPNFPASNQQPGAVRYPFAHPTRGALFVDTFGGAPTLAEIDAMLSPVIDADAECRVALDALGTQPKVDLWKVVKAKAISDLAFRLGVAPGALTGTQIANERNRIAAIYAAL